MSPNDFSRFKLAHGGKEGRGLRPRSYSETERHLMTHAKTLHGLLLAKIQQRDIASVISARAGEARRHS